MALDFAAGCVGGAVGIIVAHPLDTVKVRIQTQCPVNPKYRGTFHCLTATIKQESIAGLYKGIASPLYGVTAINALIFGVYGQLKPLVEGSPGNNALWAHFLAGATAGAVQSVIASPMELVKTRMQLDESVGTRKRPSAWEVTKNVYSKEGLRRGIFKGWCVTLSREIPGLGAYFATYEALTRGREVNTGEMLLAGGTAGMASWVSCFPMDVIKTRLQSDIQGKYNGTYDCYKKTVATEGYRALFRGLNSTLIRAFPSNAATFTVVTWIMRLAEQRLREDAEGNKENKLNLLLEQWDSVQENVKGSLRLWRVPEYNAIISLNSTNQFFLDKNYSASFFDALRNQEAKCVPNEQPHVGNGEKAKKEESINVVCKNESKRTEPGKLTEEEEEDDGDEKSGQILGMGDQGNISPGITNNNPRVKRTDSVVQGNSHNATASSLPADLSVLAEILDLPLVVLENSLDGKPLTLFNVILAWLQQGTRATFCKCLDAMDHCVCLSW